MSGLVGLLMVLLGIGLWIAGGLLPVLRLTRHQDRVDAILELTWMGALTLKRRSFSDVKAVRLTRDPAATSGQERLELQCAQGWEPVVLPVALPHIAPRQLVDVINHYVKHAGPPILTLPLRTRLSVMIGFTVLFPIGTVSFLMGISLLLQSIG